MIEVMPGRAPEGRKTVMVVEDDASVRKVFLTVLNRTGYRILEATDGEAALKICEGVEGDVSLLIADVIMPRMGGQELAREMVKYYPALKVLYVSGYSDFEIDAVGQAPRTQSFLPKPFSADILARKVREMIEESTERAG